MANELPYAHDLTIYTNRIWSRTYRWLPGGVAQDFTGWTARMQIKAAASDTTALVDLTTENGGITLDSSGNIVITISTAQTSTLISQNRPQYNLVLKSPSGNQIFDFIVGAINVVPTVSQVPGA